MMISWTMFTIFVAYKHNVLLLQSQFCLLQSQCFVSHHWLLVNRWSLVCDKSKKLQNLRKRPADQKRCFLFWIFVGETIFLQNVRKRLADERWSMNRWWGRHCLPGPNGKALDGFHGKLRGPGLRVPHRMKHGDLGWYHWSMKHMVISYRSYWMIWMSSFFVCFQK